MNKNCLFDNQELAKIAENILNKFTQSKKTCTTFTFTYLIKKVSIRL